MLVLSRKTSERIIIGTGDNRIVITLVHAENGKSRIGISAPREIPIHREEVYDLIHKDKKEE